MLSEECTLWSEYTLNHATVTDNSIVVETFGSFLQLQFGNKNVNEIKSNSFSIDF